MTTTSIEQKALAFIDDNLANGQTVDITVGWRTTRLTPNMVAKAKKNSIQLVRVNSAGDLQLLTGYRKGIPHYDILLLRSNVRITTNEKVYK